MTDGARHYREEGYLPLPGLVDPSWTAFFCRYLHTRLHSGELEPDVQVPGSLVKYGDPLFDTLLDALAPEVGGRIGIELLPTYSFVRIYYEHTDLTPHTDRPSCEVTVTLHLGAETDERWPVKLTDRRGRGVAVQLGEGDALVYDGVNLPHWRDRYDGGWYAQVFLHYVDAHGPQAEHRYDGRPALGLPKPPTPADPAAGVEPSTPPVVDTSG